MNWNGSWRVKRIGRKLFLSCRTINITDPIVKGVYQLPLLNRRHLSPNNECEDGLFSKLLRVLKLTSRRPKLLRRRTLFLSVSVPQERKPPRMLFKRRVETVTIFIRRSEERAARTVRIWSSFNTAHPRIEIWLITSSRKRLSSINYSLRKSMQDWVNDPACRIHPIFFRIL